MSKRYAYCHIYPCGELANYEWCLYFNGGARPPYRLWACFRHYRAVDEVARTLTVWGEGPSAIDVTELAPW